MFTVFYFTVHRWLQPCDIHCRRCSHGGDDHYHHSGGAHDHGLQEKEATTKPAAGKQSTTGLFYKGQSCQICLNVVNNIIDMQENGTQWSDEANQFAGHLWATILVLYTEFNANKFLSHQAGGHLF